MNRQEKEKVYINNAYETEQGDLLVDVSVIIGRKKQLLNGGLMLPYGSGFIMRNRREVGIPIGTKGRPFLYRIPLDTVIGGSMKVEDRKLLDKRGIHRVDLNKGFPKGRGRWDRSNIFEVD